MIDDWRQKLRERLAARSPREQRMLLFGGIALAILVGYGAVYEPMRQARARLNERLPVQRAELRLMQVQATEIERLRSRSGGPARGSLEQRIKSAAAGMNLGEAFTGFNVLSPDQVELATQALPTATWMALLAELERQGASVVRCRITPAGQTGLASLEMTVTGGRR